jgi:xanthine dehydrogenase accessory factor
MTPEIVHAIQQTLRAGTPLVRATLITTRGFIPVPKNSTLLVTAAAHSMGSLGNAAVEHTVQRAAQEALTTGQWSVQQCTVPAPAGADQGWYNGWVVDVLLEPILPAAQPLWEAIHALLDAGQRGMVGTLLSATVPPTTLLPKFLVGYNGTRYGTLGDTALEAHMVRRGQDVWQDEQNVLENYVLADDHSVQLFLEPLVPPPTLYVFGGGHIAPPLVHMAALAGFRPIVIDNQEAFANPTRFPEARATRVMEFEAVGATLTINPDDYLVLMTRGHRHDEQILQQLYASPARYIGLLGSSRRVAAIWERLAAQGIARQALERVHAPIGLTIGATSPEEVALSIVSEMVRERRRSATLVSP